MSVWVEGPVKRNSPLFPPFRRWHSAASPPLPEAQTRSPNPKPKGPCPQSTLCIHSRTLIERHQPNQPAPSNQSANPTNQAKQRQKTNHSHHPVLSPANLSAGKKKNPKKSPKNCWTKKTSLMEASPFDTLTRTFPTLTSQKICPHWGWCEGSSTSLWTPTQTTSSVRCSLLFAARNDQRKKFNFGICKFENKFVKFILQSPEACFIAGV